MNRKEKNKRFLDRRSRKLGKRKKKQKNAGGQYSYVSSGTRKYTTKSNSIQKMSAPEVFSVFDNHEAVTQYLINIFNLLRDGVSDLKIYLDFQSVQKVSVESIVYIIAILKNVRVRPNIRCDFMGNFPQNEAARKLFQESGFLNYVESNSARNPKTTDRIQIQTGRDTNTEVARTVRNFAKSAGLLSNRELRILFQSLIELMSNTVEHAYIDDKKRGLIPAWYLYCQYTDDALLFTFIDIGEGIPRTINRKIIKDWNLNDSKAIMSALNGEFRSETKAEYRGKGLPELKKHVIDGSLRQFKVVSGKGSCVYNESEHIFEKNEYNNRIFGTIFYWEMGKRGIK